MALVDYSSSESDSEDKSQKKVPPSQSAKPSFQKVVSSNSRKIVVNLPQLSTEDRDEDGDADRASKKPRTTGTFSGLNSFLPAPKRTGPALGTSNGLKKGVSLRTGAEPAFDRSALAPAPSARDEEDEPEAENETGFEMNDRMSMAPPPAAVAPASTAVPRFRPLSVARKAKKPTRAQPKATTISGSGPTGVEAVQAPAKPSLFSIPTEERVDAESSSRETGEYKPFVYIPDTPETSEEPHIQAYDDTASYGQQTATNGAYTDPSLDSVAADLNLTPSERRRLLGRHGAAKDGIQIKSFNLDSEYAQNRAMIESGEAAPAVNPVRAIAPGRHSIHQLLNAATSQREALEESFAAGRRVRKEAGSKYGW